MNQVANLLPAHLAVGAVTRRRARARLTFSIADGVIAMVMLAATFICYSYYYQMRARLESARAEHARVEAAAASLEVDNARIAAEIEALRSDPIVIEQVARQELGMVRSGEIVLTLAAGVNARR
jgi:cell division protein FtsB